MQKQLIQQYKTIMADLMALPAAIAAVQTDVNAAKAQLATTEATLESIESDASLTVEGKNAEERKARLAQTLRTDAVHARHSKAANVERAEIARLTVDYDRLLREFAAVGHAAKLTASLMELVAASGAATIPQDVQFGMDSAGKSAAQIQRVNGGSATIADAADLGL
jgi:septal ring factor EnvC (AmiA/AmiB activator)